MVINGRVQQGVIVLEGNPLLPEGTPVVVTVGLPSHASSKQEVKLPLVRSDRPGELNLTNDRVAEILDAEDVDAARHIAQA